MHGGCVRTLNGRLCAAPPWLAARRGWRQPDVVCGGQVAEGAGAGAVPERGRGAVLLQGTGTAHDVPPGFWHPAACPSLCGIWLLRAGCIRLAGRALPAAPHSRRPPLQQFLSAVKYCHSHCVAHRDLKLDNTLLDRWGRDGTCVVVVWLLLLMVVEVCVCGASVLVAWRCVSRVVAGRAAWLGGAGPPPPGSLPIIPHAHSPALRASRLPPTLSAAATRPSSRSATLALPRRGARRQICSRR